MSLLKTLSTKSVDINPSTYRGTSGQETFFWDDKGHEHIFSYKGHDSSLTAYQKCPPLTSIINKKAQAYINGKTWVMNVGGKGKDKVSTNINAKKITKLFARPNPLQNQKQFEAQQEIYIQLFGYCLLLVIIPVGYEKYGAIEATSMWNIPPNLLTIEETNKLFYQTDQSGIIKDVKVMYRGNNTSLDLKNIFIFKDISPSFHTLIFPESRVCSLEMPINNIIGALESRNVLINYRGANGIFSHDPGSGGQFPAMPLTPLEKEQLQADFRRYGLRRKQWQYIITTASIKWQPIGSQVKDLGLFEEVLEDSKMLCDGFGYPPHLMGLIDPTFNNQNAAEKGLYQNTIIPEAESNYDEWNNVFKTDELNLRIEKDYSHLPVLQADEVSKAQARAARNAAYEIEWRNGLCTLDEWRIANGDDALPDGRGQVYFTDIKKENGSTGNQPGATQGQENGGVV